MDGPKATSSEVDSETRLVQEWAEALLAYNSRRQAEDSMTPEDWQKLFDVFREREKALGFKRFTVSKKASTLCNERTPRL